MKRIVLSLAVLFLMVEDASARGRWFGRRSRGRVNYSSYQNYGNYSFNGTTPQEVAEQKVALLASRGYGFHPGGGFGGGYYEGWGMGSTAAQAMWNTCNGANCMSARGRAQAQSANGTWFAINIW